MWRIIKESHARESGLQPDLDRLDRAAKEEKDMKKNIKIVSVLLAFMLVLALAACGGSSGGAAADDPNLGVYKLSSLMGFSLEEYAKIW